MVWGGPGPVSGIAKMTPYAGTRSDVCTKSFATSVSVSENTHTYLGESIHPIGSPRSMQIIMQSSSDAAGTKKLMAGEDDWTCKKEVLGWRINTEAGTVALPY